MVSGTDSRPFGAVVAMLYPAMLSNLGGGVAGAGARPPQNGRPRFILETLWGPSPDPLSSFVARVSRVNAENYAPPMVRARAPRPRGIAPHATEPHGKIPRFARAHRERAHRARLVCGGHRRRERGGGKGKKTPRSPKWSPAPGPWPPISLGNSPRSSRPLSHAFLLHFN